MTAHPFVIVDKDTFYRFVAKAPEGQRYEFVRGRIVHAMTGATFEHIQISQRILMLFLRQLPEAEWAVSIADRGVETADTVRYPDVVVERVPRDGKSLSTDQPAIVVEVVSQTSGERDIEIKPAEYLQLSTLHAYIVASQDEPAFLVWLRGSDGAFPAKPVTIEGRDQVIHIPTLSIAIPLAEVYRGIGP